MALLIAVTVGFYAVYYRFVSDGKQEHDQTHDNHIDDNNCTDLDIFRAFPHSLSIHGEAALN